jgi:lysophospholipid acyltransferase (LPLAT)-like uncharacterized protein
MAKIRLKNTAGPIAWLIRNVCKTLRFQVIDHAGISPVDPPQRTWIFWHNRMFIFPWLHSEILPGRGGVVLTSASGDGQIIADVCSRFGFAPVRGSSSRKGMQALMALAECVKSGTDIGITPDGPRGPRYQMSMGVIKLAQLTGGLLMPVHVRYSRAIRFPTWDGFMLPLPFSKVVVEITAPFTLPRRMTEEECEVQRVKLERMMIEGNGSE